MINYDRIAAAYSRYRSIHPGVLENLAAAADGPAFRVLEIGCGTGNYLAALEQATGASCWGVDPSEEMLAKAREKSNRLRLAKAGAERLGLERDFFDLAFSVDVIHHVANHLNYFREAFRALKPGGKLCTVTDSEWIIRNRLMTRYFPETLDLELRRYPGMARLRLLMKSAGFIEPREQTVEFSYSLTDLTPYREKVFSALRLIPGRAFQNGLARMAADLAQGPIPAVSRYLLLWGRK